MKFIITITDEDSQEAIVEAIALLTLLVKTYTVYLDDDGTRKIACIKAYRQVFTDVFGQTLPGLLDSKNAVDAAHPGGTPLFTGVTEAEAEKIADIFNAIEGVRVHYA